MPLKEYTIEEVDITRIADTKKTTRIYNNKNNTNNILTTLISKLKSLLIDPVIKVLKNIGLIKSPFKPFDDANRRFNQMVTVRLTPKINTLPRQNPPEINTSSSPTSASVTPVTSAAAGSSSFVVGTYHMPCMFDYPAVMMIHCALSAQHIQKWAKTDPYIFTGK